MKVITSTDLRENTAGIIDGVQHGQKGYMVSRNGRVAGSFVPLFKKDLADLLAAASTATDSQLAEVDEEMPYRRTAVCEKLEKLLA